MEASVDVGSEALRLYLSEVKNSQQELEFDEEEHFLLDEAEQASDFLQKAGLSDLSKVYHDGEEITDSMVNDSIRQRNLTEKQAQTVRSRIKTLNKTLRNRQPRRKQRQDIRDVAWNAETSSTGTRSRSATPDSLDSNGGIHEDLTSDEDQQLLLPPFPLDSGTMLFKGKLKWTSSEPLPNKLNRSDRGDVAHLGSENVILKGYQPLSEYGTLVRRERSGSDPTTDSMNSIESHNSAKFIQEPVNVHSKLSRSHNSLLIPNTTDNDSTNVDEHGAISFEGIFKQQEFKSETQDADFKNADHSVCVDELTDSQYQHLKPLLWVEVTAIFDQYKISVLKRKSNAKHRRGNVFGVNLSSLVMRDMPRSTDTSMIPQIFQTIIHQLNTRITEEGILRLAGQQQKLNYLCNEIETKFYNNRKHVENILFQASVHDLTGVLKKLLRDLPDTIFTMELFDMFYKCSMIPSRDDQLLALNLLVLLLPIEHRNTFHLLLQFCVNIIRYQDKNKMALHGVAMITAPTFFSPRLLLPKNNSELSIKDIKSLSKEDLVKHVNDAAACCCIMEQLIKSGDSLWMVPIGLVQQARAAQKRAQDRKEPGKDKRLRYGKKKLHRSSTQYEPGGMSSPRIKKTDFYI